VERLGTCGTARSLSGIAISDAHIPEIDSVIHSTLEPPVLLLRQVQEDPTPAHGDPLVSIRRLSWSGKPPPRSTSSMILSDEAKCSLRGSLARWMRVLPSAI
jgi:hypothetical protein